MDNITLPQDYVEQYLYQYCNRVVYKRLRNYYNCECPICNEGDSPGRKRRFFYFPNKDSVFCHNCGYSHRSRLFIRDVASLDNSEIDKEIQEYDTISLDLDFEKSSITRSKNQQELPFNSVDLFCDLQKDFYKDNDLVYVALDYIKTRRLDTAINRPKHLYVSLDDFIHHERLIIPYYDETGKPVWYQSRQILENINNSPKYLSKIDSDRAIYNLNNISIDLPYLFVFEGAIDAMFIQNGICSSGITLSKKDNFFTSLQEQQLRQYNLSFNKIWVLDSPYLDDTAKKKQKILLDQGYNVFQWPEQLGKKFKDINEMCVYSGIDKIDPEFIIKNTHKNDFVGKIKFLLDTN